MSTFFRFLYEFLSQIANGIKYIVLGFYNGLKSMFNIPEYIRIVGDYKNDFKLPEWILVAIAILITIAFLALIVGAVYFLIR